ncbi:RNA methyltransferase [Fusobacterium necrophorum]|uniref:TrmH family RNA methyltransferase n=1 Tax=Fusobacterium necrophorum TaxID=859 RepID=UPI00254EEC3C|nr:RNA methyltransferase [Fusobacterium necrophorum]MDK4522250.1 RNA methyltransferase [Fusobacterium necrophorum]
MKAWIHISSPENEKVKFFSKLKKKKYREEERVFLAEGKKFLDYPEGAKYVLLREGVEVEEERLERFSCPVFLLSQKCFEKVSVQENSQGVILLYSYPVIEISKAAKQLIVLDDIQDPGNLGTMIRLVDAAGFSDIFLTKHSVDCYNEKVVRSSMGSIFHVRLHVMEKKEILEYLQAENYHVLVTTLQRDSVAYTEMQLKEKNAFVFGNEGHGVSKEFLELAEQKIIIPISGQAESLNVAMAAGIILFYSRDLKRILE